MMYLKGLMIAQFLVVLVVRSGSTSVCDPCSSNGCPELNCSGGKVLGAYGCCYVCAKQLGEKCGGLYGLIGTCDRGLHCLLPPQEVNLTVTIIFHVGVCQAQTTASPQAPTPAGPEQTTAGPQAPTPAGPEQTTAISQAPTPAGPEQTTAISQAPTPASQEQTTAISQAPTPASQGGVDEFTPGQNTSTLQDSSGLVNVTTRPVFKLENGVSSSLHTKEVQVLSLIMSLMCLYYNFSDVIK